MSITSFEDERTEELFRTGKGIEIPVDVCSKALQRMERLDGASRLDYLARPAGMRLRKAPAFGLGFYRIFVKPGWWLVFCWEHPDCTHVLLVETTTRGKRRMV